MRTPSKSRRDGTTGTKAPTAGSTVTSSSTTAADDPDAALLALCDKLADAMQTYERLPPELETVDRDPAEFNAYLEVRSAVIETNAKTLMGVAAKARAALADKLFYGWRADEENEGQESAGLAWSVVSDVLRVADT